MWCSRVLLAPVVNALNGFANGVLRVLGIEAKEEIAAAFNAEEVASIVERSTAEGVLEDSTGLSQRRPGVLRGDRRQRHGAPE